MWSPHVACREIIDANVTRVKRGDTDTVSVISSACDPAFGSALFLGHVRLLQMIYSRTLSGSPSSPACRPDIAAPTKAVGKDGGGGAAPPCVAP